MTTHHYDSSPGPGTPPVHHPGMFLYPGMIPASPPAFYDPEGYHPGLSYPFDLEDMKASAFSINH